MPILITSLAVPLEAIRRWQDDVGAWAESIDVLRYLVKPTRFVAGLKAKTASSGLVSEQELRQLVFLQEQYNFRVSRQVGFADLEASVESLQARLAQAVTTAGQLELLRRQSLHKSTLSLLQEFRVRDEVRQSLVAFAAWLDSDQSVDSSPRAQAVKGCVVCLAMTQVQAANASVERFLEELLASASKATSIRPKPAPSYTPGKLSEVLRCSTGTANKSARLAGVTTPKKGGSNHRYSHEEALRIAKHYATGNLNPEKAGACRAFIAELEEIAP
jgi:hypothetical protein